MKTTAANNPAPRQRASSSAANALRQLARHQRRPITKKMVNAALKRASAPKPNKSRRYSHS